MKLLGVRRSPRFSPGRHELNDRAILEGTAAELRRRGFTVVTAAEDEIGPTSAAGMNGVFSMCQGREANQVLAEIARQGTLVINSPQAVQSCYRSRLHRLLCGDWGIFAPTQLVNTAVPVGRQQELATWMLPAGLWVKRGDVHSTGPGDVVRVSTRRELDDVFADFAARGIGEAVVVPHLAGDVVKFYGVLDSPFFRYYGESKAGFVPRALAIARPRIEQVVRRLGLEIYGGDAVLSPSGEVHVIDINDWPSFANFRTEAADAIAERVARRMKEAQRIERHEAWLETPLVQGPRA